MAVVSVSIWTGVMTGTLPAIRVQGPRDLGAVQC